MRCSKLSAGIKAWSVRARDVAPILCLLLFAAPARAGYQAVLASSTYLVMIYPTAWAKDAAKTRELRRMADFYRGHGVARVDLERDSEARSADLSAGTLYLFGSPKDNRVVKRLAASLPVSFERKDFRFEGKRYGRDHGLLLALPNPTAPGRSMLLHLGLTYTGAMSVFTVPAGDWDFVVASKGVLDRRGSFAFSSRGEVLGPSMDQDFDVTRRDYAARLRTRSSPHFVFHYLPGTRAETDLPRLVSLNETIYSDLCKAFAFKGFDRPISYYLYESTEQEKVVTGLAANAHSDLETLSVHAVYAPELSAVGYHEPAHLFARAAWGEPGTKLLGEGLAVYFDGQWWDKPLDYWGGKLAREKRAPALDTLAHDDAYWTAHDPDCYALAGDFVRFLAKNYKMAQIRPLYLSRFTEQDVQAIFGKSWKSFEKRWNKELAYEERHAPHSEDHP